MVCRLLHGCLIVFSTDRDVQTVNHSIIEDLCVIRVYLWAMSLSCPSFWSYLFNGESPSQSVELISALTLMCPHRQALHLPPSLPHRRQTRQTPSLIPKGELICFFTNCSFFSWQSAINTWMRPKCIPAILTTDLLNNVQRPLGDGRSSPFNASIALFQRSGLMCSGSVS